MIALAIEVPICIFLSLWGMKEFAFYISNSEDVALITRTMWRVSRAFGYSHAARKMLTMLEYRLVLHILRVELPARGNTPRYCYPLVPLPGAWLQFLMDAAMGNCCHQS